MNYEEAIDIVSKFEYWEDASCVCHRGNPPCSKCVDQPSEELYEEALNVIEDYESTL